MKRFKQRALKVDNPEAQLSHSAGAWFRAYRVTKGLNKIGPDGNLQSVMSGSELL